MNRRELARYFDQDTVAEAFRTLKEVFRADYNASKTSRFRGRLTGTASMGSGADYHYRSQAQFLHMIELARHFDRNNMVVGQGVNRLVSNVLQQGINPDPQTGDEEANVYVAEKWKGWAEDPEQCDKAGERNLHEQASLGLRDAIVVGDICFLTLEEGSLEAVENHLLHTPTGTKRNVIHGVLLDQYRRRLQYWFAKDNLAPGQVTRRVGDMRQYDTRDAQGHKQVLHIYNPKRFSQTRGVTAFAPIVDAVGIHDDIQFAKLVQAQAASCFAILHQIPEGGLPIDSGADGAPRSTQTRSDGTTETLEGMSPGQIYRGNPGEQLSGFSPNIPNPEFFPHAMMILTFIAINLDLPLAVLLLDPTKTNFSGWRGAMDQARTRFRDIQNWMISQFYRPVYRWKIRQWLIEDRKLRKLASQSGVRIMRHGWQPPAWAYIEPSKDAQADATIIKNRLNCRRNVLGRRGLDIDQVDLHAVGDNVRLFRLAIEAAAQLNAEFPDAAVDWRELIYLDPKGRKPNIKARAMEDVARAVRAGVPVAEQEARTVLGLPAEPPKGANLLRFNDQDILAYHIETGQVTRGQVKERLNLPVEPGDDVYTVRQGLTVVPAKGTHKEADPDESEEETDSE